MIKQLHTIPACLSIFLVDLGGVKTVPIRRTVYAMAMVPHGTHNFMKRVYEFICTLFHGFSEGRGYSPVGANTWRLERT